MPHASLHEPLLHAAPTVRTPRWLLTWSIASTVVAAVSCAAMLRELRSAQLELAFLRSASSRITTNIFYADPDVAAQTEAAGTHDSKAAFRVRAGPEIAHAVEDANVAAVAFELLRMNSKPPEQESTTIAA